MADAAAGLFIATPCYGSMVTHYYLNSFTGTLLHLRDLGVTHWWSMVAGSPLVHVARNRLAAEFLANPQATHLLFIDADIEWHPEAATRLLSHDLPVVCGVYPRRSAGADAGLVLHHLPKPQLAAAADGQPLLEVAMAPTGFLMIKREVFLELIAHYPEAKLDGRDWSIEPEAQPWWYDFFPSRNEGGFLHAEDLGFYRRYRAIGGQIWIDPTNQLVHYGLFGYHIDPMGMLGPAEPSCT